MLQTENKIKFGGSLEIYGCGVHMQEANYWYNGCKDSTLLLYSGQKFSYYVDINATANILLFFRFGVHSRKPNGVLCRVIISRRHLGTVLSCLMCPLRGNAKRKRARNRIPFGFRCPLSFKK